VGKHVVVPRLSRDLSVVILVFVGLIGHRSTVHELLAKIVYKRIHDKLYEKESHVYLGVVRDHWHK